MQGCGSSSNNIAALSQPTMASWPAPGPRAPAIILEEHGYINEPVGMHIASHDEKRRRRSFRTSKQSQLQ